MKKSEDENYCIDCYYSYPGYQDCGYSSNVSHITKKKTFNSCITTRNGEVFCDKFKPKKLHPINYVFNKILGIFK